MTFLTALISVLGTLAAIGMVWVGVKLARPDRALWKWKMREREQRRAVEPIFRIYSAQRFVEVGGYRWRRWVRSSGSRAGNGVVRYDYGYDGERRPLLV